MTRPDSASQNYPTAIAFISSSGLVFSLALFAWLWLR